MAREKAHVREARREAAIASLRDRLRFGETLYFLRDAHNVRMLTVLQVILQGTKIELHNITPGVACILGNTLTRMGWMSVAEGNSNPCCDTAENVARVVFGRPGALRWEEV